MTHTSDVELWLLNRTWKSGDVTIPVYCVHCVDPAGVPNIVFWVAGNIPGSFQASAAAWFGESGMEAHRDCWVLTGSKMPDCMVKAAGVTPAYYLPKFAQEEAPEVIDEEFPMEVWRASGVSDRAVFLAVWTALITTIPKWLVAHRKPVNLGFFTLTALPLRAAWKTHVMARLPTLGALLSGTGWPAIAPTVGTAELGEVHESDHGPIVGWNIEVLQGPRWRKYIKAVESARLKSFPGESYLQQWGAIIHGLKDEIVQILRQADEKADLPAGAIIRDPQTHGRRLAARTATNSRGKAVNDRIELPRAGIVGRGALASDSGEVVEATKTSGVRSMSFVRHSKENVRNTWDPVRGRRRGK